MRLWGRGRLFKLTSPLRAFKTPARSWGILALFPGESCGLPRQALYLAAGGQSYAGHELAEMVPVHEFTPSPGPVRLLLGPLGAKAPLAALCLSPRSEATIAPGWGRRGCSAFDLVLWLGDQRRHSPATETLDPH